MTRKQYIRRLSELAIAIHNRAVKDGKKVGKLGKALRCTKMNIESRKHTWKCYDDMWNCKEFLDARQFYGLK